MSDDDDGPVVRGKRKFRSYVSDSLFDSTVEASEAHERTNSESARENPPLTAAYAKGSELNESNRAGAREAKPPSSPLPEVATQPVSAKADWSGNSPATGAEVSKASTTVGKAEAAESNLSPSGARASRQMSTVRTPKRRSTGTSAATNKDSTTTTTRKRQPVPNSAPAPAATETKNKRGRPSIKEETESPVVTRKPPGSRQKVSKLVADTEIEDPATGGFKAGQRYLCPPVGDGTRAFYESLLKENPSSLLATRYCIEHGVLIGTQHKEQFLKYQILRDCGAFKGSQGGVNKRFANGLSEEDIASWNSKKGIVSKTKATKGPK